MEGGIQSAEEALAGQDARILTLLADIASSGNLFHSWTTRTEKKIDEQ